MDVTHGLQQVNPILQRPSRGELRCCNCKGNNSWLCSSPVPAVARVLSVVAMTRSLVGPRTLVPVISVVVTLLLVLPRVVGALPGSAPGTRGAPAAGFPWLVCRVFVVF